jgi:hypothetical protein
VLAPDGRRFSKRQGPVSVLAYRDAGIPAPAMVEFLARLGWTPADGREGLSFEELAERFSLAYAQRFDALWLAGQAFTIRFELGAGPDPAGLDLVLKVVKSDGVTCYTSRQPLADAPPEAHVAIEIPELPLLSGEYLLELAVAEGPLYLEVRRHPFKVHCDAAGEGVAPLACTWTLSPSLANPGSQPGPGPQLHPAPCPPSP